MKNINKINISKDIWGAPDGVASLALLQIALTGKSFVYVARDDARMTAMADSLINSERVIMTGAGHMLPAERPAEVNDALRRFLAS